MTKTNDNLDLAKLKAICPEAEEMYNNSRRSSDDLFLARNGITKVASKLISQQEKIERLKIDKDRVVANLYFMGHREAVKQIQKIIKETKP